MSAGSKTGPYCECGPVGVTIQMVTLRLMYRNTNRKTAVLTVCIAALVMWGGVPAWSLLPQYFVLLLVLVALALFRVRQIPPAWHVVWPVPLALVVAALATPGTWGAIRMIFWAVAIVAMFLATRQDLRPGLVVLAAVCPALWLLAGWGDNRNIQAFWAMVFFVAALERRAVAAGAALGLLLFLGSRGAMLGAAAGLLVLAWPHLARRWQLATAPASVAMLATLFFIRPHTAGYRLTYWQRAMAAWQQSPWLGVGPGNLYAAQMIPEPGRIHVYQEHAHNALLTWLATTGMAGLLALLVAVYLFTAHRPQFTIKRWQVATLAAIGAHSLVDDPAWWPGPLIFTAILLGTIGERHESDPAK